ncbi:MAG: universal stress protein [Bacteroidetes bacterium]|nr:universal stress protein [Bacteroidales bacterium]MBU1009208.1 universal stress protein [Bacteroidota bacterium]
MKKTILVGIDFSDCSINALEHALTIADKAESNVVMIWVNRPDSNKEIFTIEPENLIDEVNKRFKELVNKYKYGLENGALSFMIKEGKVYQEIVKAADELEAFLIVIGTHGSSGFEEFWMGSNANKIVTSTDRPIITIRGGVDINRTLTRIVMPIDSTVESRQKVPLTALLAKYFEAEIHVLAVHTTVVVEVRSRVNEYVKQVELYLTENEVRFTKEEIEAENITDATIEYAVKVNANLISIMDDQETTTANIWLGPYAQQMVNHSPIPVLCVHAKDLVAGISM